jgi:hypothetical protein
MSPAGAFSRVWQKPRVGEGCNLLKGRDGGSVARPGNNQVIVTLFDNPSKFLARKPSLGYFLSRTITQFAHPAWSGTRQTLGRDTSMRLAIGRDACYAAHYDGTARVILNPYQD